MCGRHFLDTYFDDLEAYFDLVNHIDFKPRYNIAPQANVESIFKSDAGYDLAEMHWGIIPPWAQENTFKRPLFNARSETIWEKPSFRNLIKNKRCIIPISGFYEWKREKNTKQPHVIRIKNESHMLLGGIYQVSKDGEYQHCVVTTDSNKKMNEIHNRQPVILDKEKSKVWMESGNQNEIDNLMQACPSDWLEIYPVSNYVNNARNQGIDCITRI